MPSCSSRRASRLITTLLSWVLSFSLSQSSTSLILSLKSLSIRIPVNLCFIACRPSLFPLLVRTVSSSRDTLQQKLATIYSEYGVLLVDSYCVFFLETTGSNPSAMSNIDNVATVKDGALASDLPLSLWLVGRKSSCKPLDREDEGGHSDIVASSPHEYCNINGTRSWRVFIRASGRRYSSDYEREGDSIINNGWTYGAPYYVLKIVIVNETHITVGCLLYDLSHNELTTEIKKDLL